MNNSINKIGRIRLQKATDKQILDLYSELKSVWKVSRELGMCGQSIHERLVKLNVKLNTNYLTDVDKVKIKKLYEDGFIRGDGKLKKLARKIKRTVSFISRFARVYNLTNSHRTTSKSLRLKSKIGYKNKIKQFGHPRGFLNKKHSKKSLALISEKSIISHKKMSNKTKRNKIMKMLLTKQEKNSITPYRIKGSWKQGVRLIDGVEYRFRSSWENNYARYLNQLVKESKIKKWEYEKDRFYLKKINKTYIPDFKITNMNNSLEYHEVKGWQEETFILKMNEFVKLFPNNKFVLINKKWFMDNKKLAKIIDGWE